MPGLVEQLQADALDPKYPVTDLLRKVKVAAVKLKLPSVESWVTSELTGYDGPVPEYRHLVGIPKATDPRSGNWIPMVVPQMMETISVMPMPLPLASIEDLLANATGPDFVIAYPPNAVETLSSLFGVTIATMGLHVPRNAYAGVLDTVRTLVLDWALELERRGILGDGLSFNDDERRRAAAAPIHIGSVSGPNSRINIGTTDNSSNQTP